MRRIMLMLLELAGVLSLVAAGFLAAIPAGLAVAGAAAVYYATVIPSGSGEVPK